MGLENILQPHCGFPSRTVKSLRNGPQSGQGLAQGSEWDNAGVARLGAGGFDPQ